MKFFASTLALSLLATPALAYPNGISGYSGKSGATCTSCHLPGAPVPTVELSGPTSLAAGATGQYTLTLKGGPGKLGGAGIAASGGTLTPTTGTGLVVSNGELVQSSPKAFANGQVRFDFSLVAPASAGTVTLFASGNSANGDGGYTGDGVATTKLAVTVTADAVTPPPASEEAKGGCSTTGGESLGLLGLGAVIARIRRSRATGR